MTPPPSATMKSTWGLMDWASRSGWLPKRAAYRRWSPRRRNSKHDATLADLHAWQGGLIRRYVVIKRGGMRFGIFGVLGKEARILHRWRGRRTFSDHRDRQRDGENLRETEKVDVVIALSHGGVENGKDGRFSEGDDVSAGQRAGDRRSDRRPQPHRAAPGDHRNATRRWSRRGGSRNLGEMVITLDGDKLAVDSYRLHPIDDSIPGDREIAERSTN